MQLRELALPGVFEIVPDRFHDDRGFFSEAWNHLRMQDAGFDIEWIQENHSLSVLPYVLRGLHFQTAPFAQDKLVRVVRGAIFDVAVDIRRGSPCFGEWVGIELSPEEWNQILVPKGFAHGFLTLRPETEVIYKVSAPYSPGHEHSIRFDDPEIGIAWPLADTKPILSRKDAEAPRLTEIDPGFRLGGQTAEGQEA